MSEDLKPKAVFKSVEELDKWCKIVASGNPSFIPSKEQTIPVLNTKPEIKLAEPVKSQPDKQ